MKKLTIYIIFSLLQSTFVFSNIPLQQIYDEAGSGQGYEKRLILSSEEIYTGGLAAGNISIAIIGNASLIDLNRDSIRITGNSSIYIDGCILINGGNAISVPEEANVSAYINQCTFYGNFTAIHFMSVTGNIEVNNTILSNNARFGFACMDETSRNLNFINTFENLENNYVAWCET